mmetsp:Transcript_17127/g.40884  ORF Transcript_17127/g.40884 Transcript_17127/m.40884 type:complete len:872 (+) Transcript_17127:77-2692(+)
MTKCEYQPLKEKHSGDRLSPSGTTWSSGRAVGKGGGLHHGVAAAPALGGALAERRLRRRQPGDGHAQRRAGDVVQPDLVEEGDGRGLPAVLPADAEADLGPRLAPHLHRQLHELPHALPVKLLKRAARQDAALDVRRQELGLRVVAREAKGHLRQVVGPEAEELSLLRQLVRLERRPRHLDHRPHLVRHRDAAAVKHLLGRPHDHLLLPRQLRQAAHQRHHDVRPRQHARARRRHRRLKDRRRLHVRDVRVHDAQAAPAQPQHRVGLLQRLHARAHLRRPHAQLRRQLVAQLVQRRAVLRQELVQRRVQQADRHRQPVHRRKDALKVLPLEALDLAQRLRLARRAELLRRDHAPHRRDALLRGEEHVLRAHQPHARRAVLARHLAVLGRVRVGVHVHRPEQVHPLHELAHVARLHRRRHQLLLPAHHLARRPVERHPVALQEHLARRPHRHRLGRHVHVQRVAPAHARLAPAARHHRRVGRHPAAARQDARRRPHPAHVLRGRLRAGQQHRLALGRPQLRVGRAEHHAPHRRARRRVEPLRHHVALVRLRVLELRVQQLVQVARVHHHHRLGARDQPLALQVHRDLQGRAPRALAVARLKHEQAPLLDRELAVLHVLHVVLEQVRVLDQLRVRLREGLGHVRDGERGADARHHVLALRVHQKLPVQLVRPVCRAAGEAHARPGPVRQVAVHHRLHVHSRPREPADLVDLTVLHRTGNHPRHEHRRDRVVQLVPRIGRDNVPVPGVHLLVLVHQPLQVTRFEFGVELHAALLLQRAELLLELLVRDLQDHVAVHVEEAAIRVPRETLAPPRGQALHDRIVQAQVQNRVHHARHGKRRARADRKQERVRRIGKLRPVLLLDLVQVLQHLVPHV